MNILYHERVISALEIATYNYCIKKTCILSSRCCKMYVLHKETYVPIPGIPISDIQIPDIQIFKYADNPIFRIPINIPISDIRCQTFICPISDIKYSYIRYPIFRYPISDIYDSDIPISNIPIFRYSDIPIFRYFDIPIIQIFR